MKHRNKGYNRNRGKGGSNRPPRDGNAQSQQFPSRNNTNNPEANRNNNSRPVVMSVLPSPEILQEYEYASEGTVARLLEMAETEQDRRNQWENEYLRFHRKSLRLGQLFGFFIIASVIWGTIYLGSIGKDNVAIALSVSGFFAVALSALFSEIGRRLSRRPKRWEKR